ncbi:MAG: hypothetical protein ABSG35_15095 [Syntrophobacteraceae bacterium]
MREGGIGKAAMMGNDHQDHRGPEVVECDVHGVRGEIGGGSWGGCGRDRIH